MVPCPGAIDLEPKRVWRLGAAVKQEKEVRTIEIVGAIVL